MLCNSKYYTTHHMKNNYMTLKNSTMRHIYSVQSPKCIPCIVLASLALAPNAPTPNAPTPNTQPQTHNPKHTNPKHTNPRRGYRGT